MNLNTSGTFPPHSPYEEGTLKVSDIHTIAYYQFGNPEGQAVVYLHGGPGGGIDFASSKYFDPEKFRVVMFDQRGCGRSTPFAEIEDNNTDALVSDMERLRELLSIDHWIVFGGSWGSTLSLAYAVKFPERVDGLVLRGIFLGTKDEINHLYIDGASRFFPEEHERFLSVLTNDEQSQVIESYYKRLCSEDQVIRNEAASAWSRWEGSIIRLTPDQASIESMEDPKFAVAFARIECHYFMHNCFFDSDNYLIERAHHLKDIPTYIVHGRYDTVCAPLQAHRLQKAIPHARLEFIPDAGHSASEPGTARMLVEFMKDLNDSL